MKFVDDKKISSSADLPFPCIATIWLIWIYRQQQRCVNRSYCCCVFCFCGFGFSSEDVISDLLLCLLICQFHLLFPLQGHRRLWLKTEMFWIFSCEQRSPRISARVSVSPPVSVISSCLPLSLCPPLWHFFIFNVLTSFCLFFPVSTCLLPLIPSPQRLLLYLFSLFTIFFSPSFILTSLLSLISLYLVPFDFHVGNWKCCFALHPLFSFAPSVFPLCVYSLHFNFLLQPLSFVL